MVRVRAKISYTNTAANTLTLTLNYGATQVASITISTVTSGARVADVWFEGVATAAPGASVQTAWTCGVEGTSFVTASALDGYVINLATNSASALFMYAQWTSALATSSYQTLATEIIIL
jgi:hypothetical protein